MFWTLILLMSHSSSEDNDSNMSPEASGSDSFRRKEAKMRSRTSSTKGCGILRTVWLDFQKYYEEMTRRIKPEALNHYNNNPQKFVDYAYQKTLQKYIQGTHPHRGVLIIGNIIWALTGFFIFYVAVYISGVGLDGDLRSDLAIIAVLKLNAFLYVSTILILIPAAIGILAAIR